MAKTSIDMTAGEPWKLLLKFAVPTMLGGQLYRRYRLAVDMLSEIRKIADGCRLKQNGIKGTDLCLRLRL